MTSYRLDVSLMRHGKTKANASGTFQTDADPLDAEGREQPAQTARNFGKLVARGVITLDRPLFVHIGPAPRHRETWEIAGRILEAEFGIIPAAVQERQALAERLSVEKQEKTYLPFNKRPTSYEAWHQVLERIDPYLRELTEGIQHRQYFCVGSGGSLGMLKILMLHGLDEAYAMLEHDRTDGPDDYDPKSSQWYLNKVPNASIDVCTYREGKWSDVLRILPAP